MKFKDVELLTIFSWTFTDSRMFESGSLHLRRTSKQALGFPNKSLLRDRSSLCEWLRCECVRSDRLSGHSFSPLSVHPIGIRGILTMHAPATLTCGLSAFIRRFNVPLDISATSAVIAQQALVALARSSAQLAPTPSSTAFTTSLRLSST